MQAQNLKSILKDKGISCKEIVRRQGGFAVRGIRFAGDPEMQARMAAIAITGQGYSFDVRTVERNGQTHYQFHIQRQQ